MQNLQLSIVVVSLNTKNQFLKTIKSINSQTYTNYEIIVVDGNSTDGTVEEILKIKNKSLRYLIEKDRGIYDAMNKGVRLSKGKWIYFLNSGDAFYSNTILQEIMSYNLNKQHVVYGHALIKNDSLLYVSEGREFNDKTVVMPFCHQSCIVKSSILKKNLFNLNYKLSSDFNFLLSLYLSKKFFFKVNKIFSLVDGSGISNLHRQKVLSENIASLKEYEKKNYIFKLYILKLSEFIKSLLKFILPKLLINIILKIKYQNKLFNESIGR
jgi:glycosyltransferase involved in cell wall biosynthesis